MYAIVQLISSRDENNETTGTELGICYARDSENDNLDIEVITNIWVNYISFQPRRGRLNNYLGKALLVIGMGH